MTPTADLAQVFDVRAERAGARTAICDGSGIWTYAELLERSRCISREIERLGVRPGHRVGLMVPNSGALVASFFGAARVGGVVAPLNPRYRRQELLYYLEDMSAAAVVVTPDLADSLREVLPDLQHAPALLEVRPDGSCRIERGQARERSGAKALESPALLHQYTSGSTGDPKRIVRGHANLVYELECLAETFGLSEADRFLGAAPFSHVNGLVRTMLTSMFVGGTLYPVAAFNRRKVLETISRERITYFGGVPYMFVLLADTPPRDEVDFSSIRTLFSSSAPLLPEDNRRFQERYGLYVRQLYGSSETGTISVNLHERPGSCLESVGPPLEGIRVEILGEDREPVPPGEEGEVAISSPAAITSYEDNAEANAESFRGSFYLSGDLGVKDDQGYLTLTGRKKFLINRGGFKVNPQEVEAAIQSHPRVREVAVVGAPGSHGDELVRCVIVPEGELEKSEILQHCRERIADFKIPSRIEFRDSLPKSETGKLLRGKL